MNWKQRVADAATTLNAGLLRLVGPTFATHVAYGLYERLQRGHAQWSARIHCPDLVSPDPADRDIADRIRRAFLRAKADQPGRDAVFLPSSMWQNQLDRAFAPLRADRLDDFHAFLANFGAIPDYTGIEHSTLIREFSLDAAKRVRLEKYAAARLAAEWRDRESRGRPVSALRTPLHGNLCGIAVDGEVLSANAWAYDVGRRMVTSALPNGRVVAAELGGGYGGWVPFLMREKPALTYLDLDLPETLCCAAYYLLKCFPEKKFLLYGERKFDGDCLRDYDCILLPSFEIRSLPDRSVDLFVNCASLSEMRPQTVQAYIREICRTTDLFWHMNHESVRNEFSDGTRSLLNDEYEISDSFEQLSRHFFTWSILYYLFPENWDYHWYLYGRKCQVRA